MAVALPTAIAIPIVAGILLGGPFAGFVLAIVAALVIVTVAIRLEPRGWRRTAARDRARTASQPEPQAPSDGRRAWRRAAARRFLVPLGIAAAGIVLIAAAGGTVEIIGWGVLGAAITVAIALVFLEIGYSEDRARAREQRAQRSGRERHSLS